MKYSKNYLVKSINELKQYVSKKLEEVNQATKDASDHDYGYIYEYNLGKQHTYKDILNKVNELIN